MDKLSKAELATVIAALRHYQETLFINGEPPNTVLDIATDMGSIEPLGAEAIDSIVEKIN